MEEILEIILSAVDNASSVFGSVTSSAEEIGSTMQSAGDEASQGFDEIDSAASGATGTIQDVIDACAAIDNGTGPQGAADGMDDLEREANEADEAVRGLGNDLDIINAGMLLQTAEQIGQIAGNAEGMAQDMNEAAITVGQLATQTGIAEPQMVSLINTISNVTFPKEEAMMYVKSLDQIGVSSENLGRSATDLDKINDAFGLGANTVNSLGQELSVLGVDMNNVSTSFNALAYANANTVGGMQNYYTFLRKYDSQFKELGLNVDQASVIIAGATHKFGGGRAALSGLNTALEDSNGDLRQLEQALGLASGSLDNASAITGQYEGQLQQLADEEMEHKTITERLAAAWEDVSMTLSGVLAPLGSVVGLIGQAGSFAMQINGLTMLAGTLRTVVSGLRDFNAVQAITNAIEGEGAIARVASAIGLTTEAAAAEGATVAFGGLAIAEGAALWPILAIIAAIALLVAAVYEIGKAFGWWDDVGGMFEAISDGIRRMWNAFINHPDVQAAISAISSALQILWGAIQSAGQAVMNFFGINEAGNFDIVRALIDGIGIAWQLMTGHIRIAIEIIQGIISVFQTAGEYISGFAEFIGEVWTTVMGVLSPYISQIVNLVMGLINVFNQFKTGQLDLPTTVVTVLGMLWSAYLNVTSMISGLMLKFAGQVLQYAVRAGTNFVNGIVNRVSQVPGKIGNLLRAVIGIITGTIQSWISAAVSGVSSLISQITSPFSGVAGAISGALSGVVSAITAPFQAAWDAISPLVDKIRDGMKLIGAAGGDRAAGGDMPLAAGGDYSTSGVSVEETLNINLKVDAPGHIDTEQLGSILTDRGFIRELVNSREFQLLDSQAKERLNLKVNRSRGI